MSAHWTDEQQWPGKELRAVKSCHVMQADEEQRRGRAFEGAIVGVLIPVLVTITLMSGSAAAQSVDEARDACREAAELIEDDDIDGALDEARWCVESLEQVRQALTLTLFPDTLDGFTGGELGNQSAMGMTMLERVYVRDAESSEERAPEIKVSLTTGAAGTGLAALAQLGMSLGGSTSGKKLRIQKRTVIDLSSVEEESARYLVELKSGGMLTLESSTVDAAALLEFVRQFPISALDESLAR